MRSSHSDKKLDNSLSNTSSTSTSSSSMTTSDINQIKLLSKGELSQLVHQICSSTSEEVKASKTIHKAFYTFSQYFLQLLIHSKLPEADAGAEHIIKTINGMNKEVLKNNLRCRLLYSNAHKIRFLSAIFSGRGKVKAINGYYQKAIGYKTKDDGIDLFLSTTDFEQFIDSINKNNKVEFNYDPSPNPDSDIGSRLLLCKHLLADLSVYLSEINQALTTDELFKKNQQLTFNFQQLTKDYSKSTIQFAANLGLIEHSIFFHYFLAQELARNSNFDSTYSIYTANFKQLPATISAIPTPDTTMLIKHCSAETYFALYKRNRNQSDTQLIEQQLKKTDYLHSKHAANLWLITQHRIQLLKIGPEDYAEWIAKKTKFTELFVNITFSEQDEIDSTDTANFFNKIIDFLIAKAFEDIQQVLLAIARKALSINVDEPLYAHQLTTQLIDCNIHLIEWVIKFGSYHLCTKHAFLNYFEESVLLRMRAAEKLGMSTEKDAEILEKFSLSHMHGFDYFLNIASSIKSSIDKPERKESKEYNKTKISEHTVFDNKYYQVSSHSLTTTAASSSISGDLSQPSFEYKSILPPSELSNDGLLQLLPLPTTVAATQNKHENKNALPPYFSFAFSNIAEICKAMEENVQLCSEEKPFDKGRFFKLLNNYFIKLLYEMDSKQILETVYGIAKITSKETAHPSVNNFLYDTHHTIHFFGCYALLHHTKPDIAAAKSFHGLMLNFIQQKKFVEPSSINLAQLKDFIAHAESYQTALEEHKSVFEKKPAGINIFIKIRKIISQIILINFLRNEVSHAVSISILRKNYPFFLEKMDLLSKELEEMITSAHQNGLGNFIDGALVSLNNSRLNAHVYYCRGISKILECSEHFVSEIKNEALLNIDAIIDTQRYAKAPFYLFQSYTAQGSIYQLLYDRNNLLYLTLSKQAFELALKTQNVPEIAYLINLSTSLLEFSTKEIESYDSIILDDLFTGSLSETSTLPPPLTCFIHDKMNYILKLASDIAFKAGIKKGELFAFQFLNRIIKIFNITLVILDHQKFPTDFFKKDGAGFYIINLKIRLLASLNLTHDLHDELSILQKYAPGKINDTIKYANELGIKIPDEFLQTSSLLDAKQSEEKSFPSELKENHSLKTLSLSELNALTYEICKLKNEKSEELTSDSSIYRLAHHFLQRLSNKQYIKADLEAKDIIDFILQFHFTDRKYHGPTRQLYSWANKIRLLSQIFSDTTNEDSSALYAEASAHESIGEYCLFFTINDIINSKTLRESKKLIENQCNAGEHPQHITDSAQNNLLIMHYTLQFNALTLTLNPDYHFVDKCILNFIKEFENLKTSALKNASTFAIELFNLHIIKFRIYYHRNLMKLLTASTAHADKIITDITLNSDILMKLTQGQNHEPLLKTYAINLQFLNDLHTVSFTRHGTDFPVKTIKLCGRLSEEAKKSKNPLISVFVHFNLQQIALLKGIKETNLTLLKNHLDSISSTFKLHGIHEIAELIQSQKNLMNNYILHLLAYKFSQIQDIFLKKIFSLTTTNTLFAYHLSANLINSTLVFIKDILEIKHESLTNNQSELFKNLIAAIRVRINLATMLSASKKAEEELLNKLCKPNFYSLIYFANDLNISFKIDKEMKAVEQDRLAILELPSERAETLQSDQPEVETKASPDSKTVQSNRTPALAKEIRDQTLAIARKKEAEEKIEQAKKIMGEQEDQDYHSAISSIRNAQDVLSSKTCRDIDARLLKMEAAILLSHCYTETNDFKLSATQTRGALDTGNAIQDPSIMSAEFNYLNELLLILHNYCQALVLNHTDHFAPHPFLEENFSKPNEKIMKLISLTKTAITAAINKGMAPKQLESVSSILPTVASSSIQKVLPDKEKKEEDSASILSALSSGKKPNILSTSSSKQVAAQQAPKKSDVKSSSKHPTSYAAKAKSTEQRQNHQSSSSSSSATENQTSQKSHVVFFPSRPVNSVSKPKIEDKKQETASSNSSQENKSPQSRSHLAAFSITTEQPKALSSSTEVNEEKIEIEGYQLPEDLTIYSEAIEDYLRRRENELTIRQEIEKLNLSKDECDIFENELSEFYNLIDMDYIRIPVLINGKSFDLESMLSLPYEVDTDKPGKPVKRSRLSGLPQRKINGSLFTMETLQPDWHLWDEIKLFVKKVEEYRATKQAQLEPAEPKLGFTFSLASYSDYH